MNEDFVSFKLAKKLKEKGFREKCLAFYTSTKSFYYNNTNVCSDVEDLLECCNESEEYDDIDTPTISQVLNWLRKEKKILIVAAPAFSYREARYFWQCGIYKISLLPNVIPFHKFIDNQESHESAILAGIEYAIDNFLI